MLISCLTSYRSTFSIGGGVQVPRSTSNFGQYSWRFMEKEPPGGHSTVAAGACCRASAGKYHRRTSSHHTPPNPRDVWHTLRTHGRMWRVSMSLVGHMTRGRTREESDAEKP